MAFGLLIAMTSHLFMLHNEDEEIDKPEEPNKDFSGLVGQIKNYLLDYYAPVYEVKDAEFHMTTEEIYRQLQRILCNELIYSAGDVALWLHNARFIFADFGEMRFEFLLKRLN
jgi:hypothetical protein